MTQLWMCSACKSLNEATAKRCYHCRTDRSAGEAIDTTGAPNAPGRAAVPPRDPSLFGALIVGAIVAVVATAVWYWWDTHMSGAYFRMSWAVGLAIGVGVTLGGRGRTSFPSVLLSVFLTAVALVVGEYLLISQGIALANAVDSGKVVLADPGEVADMLPRVVAEVPLRPLLWLAALAAAFIGPWGRLVGPAPARSRER
ncbi:MAG: hypothetical protein ACJ77B_11260 [Chloroflexota bacterium]